MDYQTIENIFRHIDGDLLELLGKYDFETHIKERSFEFWTELRKNKTWCDEFLDK